MHTYVRVVVCVYINKKRVSESVRVCAGVCAYGLDIDTSLHIAVISYNYVWPTHNVHNNHVIFYQNLIFNFWHS